MTKPTFYRCGICNSMHPATWDGDCRYDPARYFPEYLDTLHGVGGWEEIDMEDVEDWREQQNSSN